MDRAASEDKTYIVYKDLYHDLLNEDKEDRQRSKCRCPATPFPFHDLHARPFLN